MAVSNDQWAHETSEGTHAAHRCRNIPKKFASSPLYAPPWNGGLSSASFIPFDDGALREFVFACIGTNDAQNTLTPIPLDQYQEASAELITILSAQERQRAARFRIPRHRYRYIVARASLRKLLAERLEIKPQHVALGATPFGKPELEGCQASSGWKFNLSYSDGPGGSLALYAFSRYGRVGVDVESVRRLDDADILARQFFSPGEYRAYTRLPPDDRVLGFFHCWTRKEAFVKAIGTGLSHELNDFDITLNPALPARILRVAGMEKSPCYWHLKSIGPAGGRIAAIVTERTES